MAATRIVRRCRTPATRIARGSRVRSGITQLRRGALPHCVLAVLAGAERYGFDLVKVLSEEYGFTTSEGTIHPLRSRLRRDGLVETTWRESVSGPPRRYYRLTADGTLALQAFRDEWRSFRDAVDEPLDTGGGP